MKYKGIVWLKKYEGFESFSDIGRDMSEMWDNFPVKIPGESQGNITITIEYDGDIVE